jgi:putative restriction endonuclease
MHLFVGITDGDWFSYLSATAPLDEVNFWQPSGNVEFKALQPGEPFLFKLHSPRDFIVGGGFFGHHSILPASLAWSAFGTKNGVKTEEEMRTRIERYRRGVPNRKEDYSVGCILLESPFFFAREDWIPIPEWPKQIVRGKGYETEIEPGKSLWERVQAVLKAKQLLSAEETVFFAPERRFGSPITVLPRLGQGSFRILITDVYRRTCAMSGSHVLHVLDAAHIKPYAKGGDHAVTNGILLRQDLHTLLDLGYVTITPEYQVEVSQRIKEEFNNGKEYYAMHGTELALPERGSFQPDPELLRWHNETVFLR